MRRIFKAFLVGSVGVAVFSYGVSTQAASLLRTAETSEFVQAKAEFMQTPVQLAGISPAPGKPNDGGLNPRGGNVFPATAKPLGYSLERAGKELSDFIYTGNDLSKMPGVNQLPFQVLYIEDFGPPATGSFTVKSGTILYVPLFNINDLPVVYGTFPQSSASQADVNKYIFDPTQVGLACEVKVDGKPTVINQQSGNYAAGPFPIKVEGLEGYNNILIGIFLTPLNKGTHTVSAACTLSGEAFLAANGGNSYSDAGFTYIVQVE